jgi:hypothetical protein
LMFLDENFDLWTDCNRQQKTGVALPLPLK